MKHKAPIHLFSYHQYHQTMSAIIFTQVVSHGCGMDINREVMVATVRYGKLINQSGLPRHYLTCPNLLHICQDEGLLRGKSGSHPGPVGRFIDSIVFPHLEHCQT